MPHLTTATLILASVTSMVSQAAQISRPVTATTSIPRPAPAPARQTVTRPMVLSTPVPRTTLPNPRIAIDPRASADFRKQQTDALEKKKRALKLQEEARIQREKDRKLALCKANDGEWIGKVQGISLTAAGSDVDEIYGKISVGGVAGARYSSSHTYPAQGWGPRELWASEDNVNIGKYDQKPSTVTIVSTSTGGEILITMDLRDEDDARGGTDDEFFYLTGVTNSWVNFKRFEFYVPPCWQSTEFAKSWRVMLTARPMGSAAGNQVSLFVSVEVYRRYP